jgi:glycosyltransferase involved in cell wall biosynthesis
MHILICSFEYGWGQGAEGICTMRLAEALAAAGERVTVLTSDQADCRLPAGGSQIHVSAKPFAPQRAFAFLRRIVGRFLHTDFEMFWRRRIRAVALPSDVDVVYGRAMPLAGIVAAKEVANRLRRPLLVHFSDPPLSPWYAPPPLARKWRLRHCIESVERAAKVSFTTEAALGYSRSTLGLPLGDKGFVLHHVAPAPTYLPRREPAQAPVYLYAGHFYGNRQPTSLLAAFKQVLAQLPDARFRFVGTDPAAVEKEATQAGVRHAVDILPFTRDVAAECARADVLVAIDAADRESPFLSTKLVEYLMVDRMALVVTPRGSPSDLLAARAPRTTISVPDRHADIVDGMFTAARAAPGPQAFEERFASMRDFSAESVAACFVMAAAQALQLDEAGAR